MRVTSLPPLPAFHPLPAQSPRARNIHETRALSAIVLLGLAGHESRDPVLDAWEFTRTTERRRYDRPLRDPPPPLLNVLRPPLSASASVGNV